MTLILLSLVNALTPWITQASGTDASLRGVCAVSATVAWASGTKGTVLRTTDGGAHWATVSVPGAEALDFRGIRAFDADTAFALSSGPGDASRIYKTVDGGRHWRLQFTNALAKGFYDGFAFWDKTHGIAMSDPVDGKFRLLTTEDGEHWAPLTPAVLADAVSGEGGFAASNTCVAVSDTGDVWFVTGGSIARVFHSADRGQHWTASASPIISGAAAQGIFSIAVAEKGSGESAGNSGKAALIVGGDYEHASVDAANAAYSLDGGATWVPAETRPRGYRSCVAFLPGSPLTAVAVGTTGSDYARDGGKTWQPLDTENYNAVSFAPSGDGWAVGPHGQITRFGGLLGR